MVAIVPADMVSSFDIARLLNKRDLIVNNLVRAEG